LLSLVQGHMAAWQFRTVGSVALVRPNRIVPLDDPLLIALLAVLAVEGDAGIASNDLQLLLTPDAKREAARRELARLIARARELLGENAIDVSATDRYALAANALSLDVDVLSNENETACAEFLRDAPLPDTREFRQWLSATRRRVASRTLPIASDTPLRAGRRGLLVGATASVIALLLAGAIYSTTTRPATGFAEGDVVMLSDVANSTGDTLFDQALLAAATVALQQSGRVRLYSRSRLATIYQLMNVAEHGTVLDYELAKDVAERDHVRWVLGLSVSQSTGGYHIGARVADVQQRLEVADVAVAAPMREDVIRTLDEVLVRVRRKLAESRWDVRARHTALPLVTTASLEALRSYAEGSVAWSSLHYDRAGELWLRAVDLDTGFAMAYGSLGNWYYYHHDRAKGEHYYEEALKRSARLTDWERLKLLDGQASYRGNADSSLALSRIIADRFPSNASWYSYGVSLMRLGRREDAMAAFRRALRFDSLHVNSWINLATSAKGLRRFEEAIRFYEKAGSIDSTVLYSANINGEYGGALVMAGRTSEAEVTFRRMVAADRIADRMLGLRSLGWLALWQGRLYEAIGNFQQSIDAAQQSNNALSEGRNRILLAGVYRAANREAEANAEITRALALAKGPAFEPSMLAVLVYACQQLDRPRDVEWVAALLHERVAPGSRADRAAEAYANAVVQLVRHHPDSALAFLRQTGDFAVSVQRFMSSGEAFRALGQRDSTRRVLQALIDSGGFGAQGQDDWLRAPLLLGDVLLAAGDSAGAAKRYRELTARWRDAPSDTPDLVTARARLAALAGARR